MPAGNNARMHRVNVFIATALGYDRRRQAVATRASLVRLPNERNQRWRAASGHAAPAAGWRGRAARRVDGGLPPGRRPVAARRRRPGHDRLWLSPGKGRRAAPACEPTLRLCGRRRGAGRTPARRQDRSRKAACSGSRRGSRPSLRQADPTAFLVSRQRCKVRRVPVLSPTSLCRGSRPENRRGR
jgi:hypothetical protein